MNDKKSLSQMTRKELLDYLHNTKEGQQMLQDIKKIMQNKCKNPNNKR